MKKIIPLLFAFILLPMTAQAVVVMSSDTNTVPAELDPPISGTDLLETNLASSTISGFDPVASYAPSSPNGGNLFNGAYDESSGYTFGQAYIDSSTGTPWTVEFTLDTTSNILGYDISEINVFSGWNSGLTSQDFTVEVSLVGDAAFVSLGRFTMAADSTGLVVSLTENNLSGLLATGVDVIRFTHHTGSDAARGAYREIDVIGAATVPEPSAAVLLLGGLGLLIFRRARRNAA